MIRPLKRGCCARPTPAVSRPSGVSTSTCGAGRCSACSGPTAPASRPRSACSRPRSDPLRAPLASGGFDVAPRAAGARSISSVVFQDPVLDRPQRPGHLDLHARLWGSRPAAARGRIDELAEALDLAELLDRPVKSYSGGERRRLEIARALVSDPRVLFLDEPTVGLDPRIRHELLDVIAGLRARREMTILVTTHYLDEAERLCDRVAIIHAGRIVALDTPASPSVPAWAHEILEFRVAGDPGPRSPACARAASPARTPSRSAHGHRPAARPRRRRRHRRDRCRPAAASQRSPPASRPSTTSTCD